jgi:hypothetical protein
MDPVSLAAIAVCAGIIAGFGAGWGLKPDASVKALEQQTEAIGVMSAGQRELVSEVQRVAVEEAERDTMIADKLTDTPPQCVSELGGDPMSPQCAWAWCVRDGESDAQRCQDSTLQAYLVERWKVADDCRRTDDG